MATSLDPASIRGPRVNKGAQGSIRGSRVNMEPSEIRHKEFSHFHHINIKALKLEHVY